MSWVLTGWDCQLPCSHEHCLIDEFQVEDVEELLDLEIYYEQAGLDYEVEEV